LKKMSEIIGMNVVDANGNFIGEVEKMVYSRSRKRILGIFFRKGRIIKDKVAILFKDILSIGPDAIIIKGSWVLVNPSKIVEMSNVIEEEQDIVGYPVLTVDGTQIGEIKDIVLDETHGNIEGYILSGDFIEDLMQGRRILKFDDIVTVGEEAVIVDNHQTDSRNYSQGGGLKNLLKLEE